MNDKEFYDLMDKFDAKVETGSFDNKDNGQLYDDKTLTLWNAYLAGYLCHRRSVLLSNAAMNKIIKEETETV
jgi:hypothetical protein